MAGLLDTLMTSAVSGAVSAVASDPDLGETLALLHDITMEEVGKPGAGAKSAGGFDKNKISQINGYLRLYRYHQIHPWLIPGILGAVAIALVTLGVAMGRKR